MKRLFILLFALLLTSTAVFAFRIEYGNNITISKPVYEDLYVAGGNIMINAPVYGDLIIAGGTIVINDSVSNDILLAGGNVTFNGYVGDDIRCAGGELRVMKNVSGDLVVTGGTLTIDKDVSIGSLITSGGEVQINGTVNQVKAASGNFTLNGVIMKSLDVRGGTIKLNGIVHGPAIISASRKITIGNEAQFHNSVRYWSHNKVDFGKSVLTGAAVFDNSIKINYPHWYYLGFATWFTLFCYLGMAYVVILLLQYFFSNTMKAAGTTFYHATLKSLGYGFVFVIALPIVAVFTLVTVIGAPIGVLLLFSYIIIIVLTTAITAVVAANWLNTVTKNHWGYWRMTLASLLLFMFFKLLTFTPFFGWLIMIVIVLIAFGAILLNVHWKKSKQTGLPA